LVFHVEEEEEEEEEEEGGGGELSLQRGDVIKLCAYCVTCSRALSHSCGHARTGEKRIDGA
jgi:hypothetical protein